MIWAAILFALVAIGSATWAGLRWAKGTLTKLNGPVPPWVDAPGPKRPWPPSDGSY